LEGEKESGEERLVPPTSRLTFLRQKDRRHLHPNLLTRGGGGGGGGGATVVWTTAVVVGVG
jgi:hypothetical protein